VSLCLTGGMGQGGFVGYIWISKGDGVVGTWFSECWVKRVVLRR
jgi:hypothetical protein